jgi:glycosyltransferase involved in cell wall biosynthesis
MTSRRPSMVVLAPIAPAETGNGLAMRVHTLVRAAGVDHDVHLVVVPVSGSLPAHSLDIDGLVSVDELPVTEQGDRSAVVELLGDPLWRTRIGSLQPLPEAVALAPPTLASQISELIDGEVDAVLACRLALAPLGVAMAERAQAPLIVDADDADVAYFEEIGDVEEAVAWDRVARLCLPLASLVMAASAEATAALGRRYGVTDRAATVPNSVIVPTLTGAPNGLADGRLLFVGNMTYRPNSEGAIWLVETVLPRLAASCTLELVGAAPAVIRALAGPSVVVTGWVADIDAHYHFARVATVPLHSGSGSRTKILEAFAHHRPVVSTAKGLEGIAARDGEHLLVANTPAAFARAIEELLEPGTADPLIEAAARLVAERYDRDAITKSIATLLSRLTAR